MPVCEKTVVLDSGTGFVKCGFGKANFPTAVFPTMVGRPLLRSGEKMGDIELKDIMMGDEAAEMRNSLEVNYPVRNGVVNDWNDMEILWEHAFSDKLGVTPPECKLLLTEAPRTARKHREKLVDVMFSKFGFSHVYIGGQGLMSLYAAGLLTGLVLDSGEGCTHTVPVYDGYDLPNAVKKINMGGRDVTEYLIKLLLRRGYPFNRSADFDTVRQIKERFCYVACDFELEKRLARETCVLEQAYQLPDGRVMKIGSERFEAPEALFRPSLVDKEGAGLSQLIYDTIQDCDIDLRMKLYEQVVLSGGSTMYPGLPTRIENDIKEVYTVNALKGDKTKLAKFKLHIEDQPRRRHMAFLGAAVLAELMDKTPESWTSKAEYEEKGAGAIWDKCA